jgi:hypothetical protein
VPIDNAALKSPATVAEIVQTVKNSPAESAALKGNSKGVSVSPAQGLKDNNSLQQTPQVSFASSENSQSLKADAVIATQVLASQINLQQSATVTGNVDSEFDSQKVTLNAGSENYLPQKTNSETIVTLAAVGNEQSDVNAPRVDSVQQTPVELVKATVVKADAATPVISSSSAQAVSDKATQDVLIKADKSVESPAPVNDVKKPLLFAGQPPPSYTPQTVDEQTVSLNQSLHKMRAGLEMASSHAPLNKGLEESLESKPNLPKMASGNEILQQLSGLQNSLKTTNPVQMQMPAGTPPTAKNWGRAVADKVIIAASQNLRVANIQLDPPELGALQVRLQVVGPDQQMSVSFTSPHAAVRDVLEQQLPRLREMLEEQGINLGESSVNDQKNQSNKESEAGNASGSANYVGHSDSEPAANSLNTQGTLALVDFYA